NAPKRRVYLLKLRRMTPGRGASDGAAWLLRGDREARTTLAAAAKEHVFASRSAGAGAEAVGGGALLLFLLVGSLGHVFFVVHRIITGLGALGKNRECRMIPICNLR